MSVSMETTLNSKRHRRRQGRSRMKVMRSTTKASTTNASQQGRFTTTMASNEVMVM